VGCFQEIHKDKHLLQQSERRDTRIKSHKQFVHTIIVSCSLHQNTKPLKCEDGMDLPIDIKLQTDHSNNEFDATYKTLLIEADNTLQMNEVVYNAEEFCFIR